MKLKATLSHILGMCPEAWYIFIRSIQLCCVLLLCAFILLLKWDGHMAENYSIYMTAMALHETGQAILLTAMLASVCIEDIKR